VSSCRKASFAFFFFLGRAERLLFLESRPSVADFLPFFFLSRLFSSKRIQYSRALLFLKAPCRSQAPSPSDDGVSGPLFMCQNPPFQAGRGLYEYQVCPLSSPRPAPFSSFQSGTGFLPGSGKYPFSTEKCWWPFPFLGSEKLVPTQFLFFIGSPLFPSCSYSYRPFV